MMNFFVRRGYALACGIGDFVRVGVVVDGAFGGGEEGIWVGG